LKKEAAGFSESLLTICMVWNSRKLLLMHVMVFFFFHRCILVVSVPPPQVCVYPALWLLLIELKKCEAQMASSELGTEYWNMHLLMTLGHTDRAIIA
jgi:hypothetical protein